MKLTHVFNALSQLPPAKYGIFGVTLLLMSISSFSQTNYQLLSRIDNFVEEADSLSNKSQRTWNTMTFPSRIV